MPMLTFKKMATKQNPNRIAREHDEFELAVMAAFERSGVRVTERMTLGQMAFGSDEAAEAMFRKVITAYQS